MCYDGIISIKGLCSTDTAKLYLDDIGISLLMAANTADEKYITGKKLVEAAIKQAWADVFHDVKFDGLQANKTLNDFVVGKSTEDPLEVYAGYRGLKFTLHKGCKLTRFFLHKVSLCIKDGGATTIIIRQGGVDTTLYTGTPLDNTTIEILVNDFVEDSFQLLSDNTAIQVCSGTPSISCGGATVRFTVTGSDDTNQNFGISADLQVRCDKSKHLCKYVDQLAPAARYRAGALIWKALYDTNRYSDFLNIKKDKAETQMAWLDSNFNLIKFDPAVISSYKPKGMYQQELEKLNIPVPKCACCLECDGEDHYTMVLP